MTRSVEFTVHGEAKPQGSKRHVGGGRMVESSKGLPLWRNAVSAAAALALDQVEFCEPMAGALCVEILFLRIRPKSTPKSVLYPVTAPDIDKLARAVLDACEGILYLNDKQVVRLRAEKDFGSSAKTHIAIHEVSGGRG